MKTNITYVDASKFETICLAAAEKHGLAITAQKGFVKVGGPKGRAVYVASTKRVGRVDLSGFEMEGEGYVSPHCGPFGNVKQQLDMSLGEEAILANFAALLDHLATLAPVEKAARKAPATKADAPKGWTSIDTSVAKQSRKDRIAKKAASSSQA
jgi:hypothetical protein